MTHSRIYIVKKHRWGWPWFGLYRLIYYASKGYTFTFWMLSITTKFSIGVRING